MPGQLQERRAGGREFQIVGHATETLRAPNDVCANGAVSRLVLEDLKEQSITLYYCALKSLVYRA